MEGGNRLWLHARMCLSRDDATYEAFQKLYELSCDPSKAREWWHAEPIPDMLARYEVVPLDVANDPDFNLSPGSPLLAKLEADLAHPGDFDQEGNDMEGEVPMKHVARHTIRQVGFGIHGEGCAVLPTTYPGQCILKLDPTNDYLVYDMLEAAPMLASHYTWPIAAEEAKKTLTAFEKRPGAEEDTDEDEAIDESVLFFNPDTDKMAYFFMGSFCNFREARVMRMRVDLNNISSIVLLGEPCSFGPGDEVQILLHGTWHLGTVTSTPKIGSLIEVEYTRQKDGQPCVETSTTLPQYIRRVGGERMGVLMLEMMQPVESFATRAVYSKVEDFNQFAPMGDWSPEGCASESLRHYIVGDCHELRKVVVEMLYQREDLKDYVKNPSSVLDAALPEGTPQCDPRHPAQRRLPFFGKIEGIDEAGTTVHRSVTAGHSTELSQLLFKDLEEAELEEEERDMKQQLGLAEDPNFQFPKHPEARDAVLSAAAAWAEGKAPPKAAPKPDAAVPEDTAAAPVPEPEPEPEPTPTAELCPPGKGSSSWSCGQCKKSGLLAFMRRCPGCGIALAPKRAPTSLSALREKARKAQEAKPAASDEPVPDNWEDA